jgi:hypothetical protein
MRVAIYRWRSELSATDSDTCEPAAWRVNDWRQRVPISRSKFYEERNAGRIKTVKLGSATLVVTSPRTYIDTLKARAT